MIQLGTTQRADENLKEMLGIYKKETNERYYSFNQIEWINKGLNKKGMRIPTLQDFLDSWFTKKWEESNKKLANKLWLGKTGFCDAYGAIFDKDTGSYLWSSSLFESSSDESWAFRCAKEGGGLRWDSHDDCFPLRPVFNNSKNDILSSWLFEKIVEWAEKYWAKLWAKAWYELWNILLP